MNPRYVTEDGCTEIGKLVVDMPWYGKERKVVVSLCFGEEEITCSGENESNDTVRVKLDLLGNSQGNQGWFEPSEIGLLIEMNHELSQKFYCMKVTYSSVLT